MKSRKAILMISVTFLIFFTPLFCIAIDKSRTGLYYPTGSSNLGPYANWLASGCPGGGGTYFDNEYHIGHDYQSDLGEPVYAIADGTVLSISNNGWGTNNVGIFIKHKLSNGNYFLALYGHIRSSISANDDVMAGVPFATIGSWPDGDHLHLGIVPGNTLPPSPWGRMDCNSWPSTNGFINPIIWIENQTPNGNVGQYVDGFHNNGTSQAFINAFNQHKPRIGWPFDNGGGSYVHKYEAAGYTGSGYRVWAQDFQGNINGEHFGTDGQTTIILNDYFTPYKAYLVKEGIWGYYKTHNGPYDFGMPFTEEITYHPMGQASQSENYANSPYVQPNDFASPGDTITVQKFMRVFESNGVLIYENDRKTIAYNWRTQRTEHLPVGEFSIGTESSENGVQWYVTKDTNPANDIPWPKEGVKTPTGKWFTKPGRYNFARHDTSGQRLQGYGIIIEITEGNAQSANPSPAITEPKNVIANADSPHKITLNFTPPLIYGNFDIKVYEVSPYNQFLTRFAAGNPPANQIAMPFFEPSTEYCFEITASATIDGTDYESVRSNRACAITPAEGPIDVWPYINDKMLYPANGQELSSTSITLQWSAKEGNGTLLYSVYYAEGGADVFANPPLLKNTTQTSYTLTNLTYNKQYYWRVKVVDEDGDESSTSTIMFTVLPESNPPTGSITIANGASTTNSISVPLNLSAIDTQGKVTHMHFSNNGEIWSEWYPYNSSLGVWNLGFYGGSTSPGIKTVYVQFRDNSGNISAIYSDNITLQEGTPGNIILNGNIYTSLRQAVDDAQPGETIYVTAGWYDLTTETKNSPYFDQNPNLRVGCALKDGVSLIGEGASKTTLYWQDGAAGLIINDNNEVSGLTIISPPQTGLWTVGVWLAGSNSTIRNCIIKNSNYAIESASHPNNPLNNVTIQNCLIINNENGVRIDNINNVKFYNNVIGNSKTYGLSIQSGQNINIQNNTITSCYQGVAIEKVNIAGLTFTNNNVYGNYGRNYNADTSSWLPDQTGINGNISQAPQFVNPENGDFYLSSSSLLVNAGTDVGLPFSSSAPDIGAFEYNASGSLEINSNILANFFITKPDGSSQTIIAPWSQSNLPIGIYGIYPQAITGYSTPRLNFISLSANETKTFHAFYTQILDASIDAHSSPQNNLPLESWHNTEAEKMSVLKFRLTDHGQDGLPTLIDQIIININGAAGQGGSDIAWAELRGEAGRIAEANLITNSQIILGSPPNNDNCGQLLALENGQQAEYTVYLYLNNSLQGQHGGTYIFNINEGSIGVDGANSSQIAGNTGSVHPVTGTLFIENLGLSISPDTGWLIGPLPLNSQMESPMFTITNTGNVAAELNIKGSDGLNDWQIQSVIGNNNFKVEVDIEADGRYETSLTPNEQILMTSMPAGGQKIFKLKYSTPSHDNMGAGIPHNFIATLKAVANGLSSTPLTLSAFTSLSISPGDVNNDKVIDLKDAIMALQILTNSTKEQLDNKGADINGNGRIGVDEAINALQTAAGLRNP